MYRLFSDIDNTLIYSHRRPLPEERIAVETLDNRVISYMTATAYDFFCQQEIVQLVPVTMRTPTQYSRLKDTFDAFGVHYALVCNGAILLDNNAADVHWLAETKSLVAACQKDLESVNLWLELNELSKRVYSVDGIMTYAVTEQPQLLAMQLNTFLTGSALCVYSDGRKVYCLPKVLSKGLAIQRFSDYTNSLYSVAAGDGMPDISMLNAADFALLPEALSNAVCNRNHKICPKEQYFSDFICDYINMHQIKI